METTGSRVRVSETFFDHLEIVLHLDEILQGVADAFPTREFKFAAALVFLDQVLVVGDHHVVVPNSDINSERMQTLGSLWNISVVVVVVRVQRTLFGIRTESGSGHF